MNKMHDSIDWTSLADGFVVDGKYRVIKALINGSGGSVYQVSEISEENSV